MSVAPRSSFLFVFWFLALSMVGFWAPVRAQTCPDSLVGQVRGLVAGGEGVPLAGATVVVRETKKGTNTNATGRFGLAGLCPGTYTLDVRYQGYTPLVRTVQLPGPALPALMLTPSSVDLDEIHVTEHRSEAQQLLQVQDQLTGAALEATRGQSLGESLKNITGLYSIQTGPTLSKPVIHGLYSNRIITLNNGIRQEDQQWGSEHAPQIDPFVARRITVIKGAASIRYGSDAIGGVILVEPDAMPTRPGLRGDLTLAGATNGRMGVVSGTLEGAFSKRLSGLSWRVQGTLKQSGYARAPGYFLENTSYREGSYAGDLHYDGKKWGIELYISRFTANVGLFTGAQVGSLADLYAALARPQPLRQPGFSYALNRPYQDLAHTLVKLRAYWEHARLGTFTTTLAQQHNRRDEFDFLSFSRIATPELSLQLSTTTADLVWEQRPRTTAGGGRWLNSAGLNGIGQANIRQYLFLIPNYETYGLGAFTIQRYAKNQWVAEVGLRYDYRWLRAYFLDEPTNRVTAQTHQWRNTNASAGVAWQVRSDLLLTANLSTAWRAPNVSDLYSNGLHQSAVAYERGNPNLKPEQAYNGNLAVAYARNQFRAELGVYNNLITNYIYLRPDSLPIVRQRGAFPAYSYTQLDAVFRGLDITLSYTFKNRLSLTSKTSLLSASEAKTGRYLVLIPPNRTDNSVRYTLGTWKKATDVYLSVSGLYVARQTQSPAVSQRLESGQLIFTGDFSPPPPAYFLVNAELGFALPVAGHPWRVVLTGTNLANTDYRDYLNRFRYFADEPGRTISLRIRVPIGGGRVAP